MRLLACEHLECIDLYRGSVYLLVLIFSSLDCVTIIARLVIRLFNFEILLCKKIKFKKWRD